MTSITTEEKVQFSFFLFSLNGALRSNGQGFKKDVDEFLLDLFDAFNVKIQDDNINIEAVKNTDELRNKISILIHKYNTITMYEISSYIKRLKEEEELIFAPINLTDELGLHMTHYLVSLKEQRPIEDVKKEFKKTYEKIQSRYFIKRFDENTRQSIGELDKAKRVCRFCGLSAPKTTFKNKAHAISEALGNKRIICNEECDKCNDKFARTIEKDIILYLDLFRVILSLKGKKKSLLIKGENFEMSSDKNVGIKINLKEVLKSGGEALKQIKLNSSEKISFQNIYKTLCKFALSVMDNEGLRSFSKTIQWINGEHEELQLPKISYHFLAMKYTKQPQLLLFVRKRYANNIPHATCKFTVANMIFFFVIPFSEKDKKNFLTGIDYNKYWNFFDCMHKESPWDLRDFSNSKKIDYTVNLNFNIPDQWIETLKNNSNMEDAIS